MTRYSRYAVYYAPPSGSALARFGSKWLGWDAEAGTLCVHPDMPGLPVPVSEITATPRKYGFHGTLKPPFRLAEGMTADALAEAARALAATRPAFTGPPLVLRRIGHFVALVPEEASGPLIALAADCVRDLDRFRAPAGEAELARRRQRTLSPAQEANLTTWGYPYVLDEFRFHLTLSGGLDEPTGDAVLEVLEGLLPLVIGQPLEVREICLFGESESGHFHIIDRYPLAD